RVLLPERLSRGKKDSIHSWVIPWKDGPAPALPLAGWSEYKKVAGVLTAVIPLDNRASVYALWGDWFAWGCWGVVALGVGWCIWTRWRRPSPVLPRRPGVNA